MLPDGNRPLPAGRGCVSISVGGAPIDRVEWPVFGEQIDDLTIAASAMIFECGDPEPVTYIFILKPEASLA